MKFFEKRKKKKNATRGRFQKIEIDGKALPILNFYLFFDKDKNRQFAEIAAADEIPELHFSSVTMTVFLSDKKMTITGNFDSAYAKGKFKIYKFEITELKEYYI